MRLSVLALVPAVAVALFGASGPARSQEAEHADHEHRNHQWVRIGSGTLRPATLTVQEGDAFGWVNYTPKIAEVSFDRSVARNLICTTKGSFRLVGERLVSGAIQARQFASLCQLKPGEYDYRVSLRSGAGGSSAPLDRTLEGKLIVTRAGGA